MRWVVLGLGTVVAGACASTDVVYLPCEKVHGVYLCDEGGDAVAYGEKYAQALRAVSEGDLDRLQAMRKASLVVRPGAEPYYGGYLHPTQKPMLLASTDPVPVQDLCHLTMHLRDHVDQCPVYRGMPTHFCNARADEIIRKCVRATGGVR